MKEKKKKEQCPSGPVKEAENTEVGGEGEQ